MVVVLVMDARTATPAKAAGVLFTGNGQAANMLCIVPDGVASIKKAAQRAAFLPGEEAAYASALTTASPICAVPTLVVPSL